MQKWRQELMESSVKPKCSGKDLRKKQSLKSPARSGAGKKGLVTTSKTL